MAKKKEDPAPAGAPAWMATFSDLMNLLLCFFVLLFSMSTIEEEKLQAAISSITSAFSIMDAPVGNLMSEGNLISMGITQLPDFANYFGDTMSQGSEDAGDNSQAHETRTNEGINDDAGGQDGQDHSNGETPDNNEQSPGGAEGEQDQKDRDEQENPGASTVESDESDEQEAQELLEEKALDESEKMAEAMLEKAKEYGIQDLIDIDFNGQYVRYSLNGALLFESGKSEIRKEARPLMKKLARILSAYSAYLIEVEGHTDNVPIHSAKYESNMVLSMYRALSVSDFILGHSKLDPAGVYSSGRGEYDPIADNGTPEGRARNRRVEIKIYNSYSSDKLKE